MSDSVSLILDTDIGDDVDDAFALAQAALHPSIDLVAITTCWGDTAARARLARRVLDAAGGDRVPIHPGPDTSFDTGDTVATEMTSGQGHIPSEAALPTQDAVDYLVETVLSAPGEFTLCAVGPLTNVAHAIRRDGGFASALAGLVVMGGRLAGGEDEYNFRCDLAAAEVVLQSDANLRIGPIDSTRGAVIDRSHLARLTSDDAELPRLLAAMLDQYLDGVGRDWTSMYDPVTLSSVYSTEFCRIESRDLGLAARGKGRLEPGLRHTEIIGEVNGPAFIEHLMALIN